MRLIINGQTREFPTLVAGSSLSDLITTLELKSDRVAVEQNGTIVPRAQWIQAMLKDSDRLEMVHFVGGGVAGSLNHPVPLVSTLPAES